jgi:hypothetical protein
MLARLANPVASVPTERSVETATARTREAVTAATAAPG